MPEEPLPEELDPPPDLAGVGVGVGAGAGVAAGADAAGAGAAGADSTGAAGAPEDRDSPVEEEVRDGSPLNACDGAETPAAARLTVGRGLAGRLAAVIEAGTAPAIGDRPLNPVGIADFSEAAWSAEGVSPGAGLPPLRMRPIAKKHANTTIIAPSSSSHCPCTVGSGPPMRTFSRSARTLLRALRTGLMRMGTRSASSWSRAGTHPRASAAGCGGSRSS